VKGVRNGLGVAALVLGIISLLFMIFLPPIGVVLGILALIFGIIGVRRARRGEATNRGQALAGAITGGIGLVASVVILTVVGIFISTHHTQINQYTQCLQNAHTQHARDVCNQQFRNSINR
jgi:FtsH-binding integral membrane protein